MANPIAVGSLNQGQLMLLSVNADGSILIRMGGGAGWTDWMPFQSPPCGAHTIAVGTLPDQALQLFSTNAEGTFTCWQEAPPTIWEGAPNAGWTPWSAF
jgi:hypothetical protein